MCLYIHDKAFIIVFVFYLLMAYYDANEFYANKPDILCIMHISQFRSILYVNNVCAYQTTRPKPLIIEAIFSRNGMYNLGCISRRVYLEV